MSERYPGGLITKTPVTPSGPYETSTASGIWTLDQQAYWRKLNQWPIAGSVQPDAQFNYVTMLLHGDGTNGAQNNTFVDSSTNNFTITRNGNTTQGTFTPYGSNWSSYLGTNGNYFTSGTNAALGLSTGDWTIEFFLNVSQFVDNQFLIDFRPSGSGGATQPLIYLTTAGTLLYFTASATRITSSTGVITLGTWAHIAVSRASGSTRMFVNGVQTGSTYTDSNNYGSSARFVNGTYGDAPGATNNNGGVISGYISNLRILKGTGLYTGSYTVPTAPLTAITNTSCLTYQSNRFVDNSGNSIAITPSGSPSVQRFNPFGTATAYSTSVIGGSAYFDGTGDWLSVVSTPQFDFGTGNFTLECWAWSNNLTSDYRLIAKVANISSFGSWQILIDTSGYPRFYASSAASSWDVASNVGGGVAIVANTWNHIAVTRSGTTFTIWVNGVSAGTTTNSSSIYYSAAVPVTVGGMPDGTRILRGYITDARILKGTAQYTSTFTPTTTPLTAIANTSLLANMTNGAIFDNAMMNDLETVGNAQISTSVKKYGTGSLAFDGTDDVISFKNNPSFAFGTGSFTIEFWINGPLNNDKFILEGRNAIGTMHITTGGSASTAGVLRYVGSSTIVSSNVITDSTWHHCAIVRNGSSNITLYVDGISVGTGTDTTNYTTTTGTFDGIGGRAGVGNYLTAYIDDFRITKGYARYTATFTPPTAAFPNIGPT